MDRRVLPLLIALSGLSHPSPEPQQKFPEDFYGWTDSSFEHPLPPDEAHPSGSFCLSNFGGPSLANFETSPVHGSSTSLQSNVDLRIVYHSIMNPTRPLHVSRQHVGHAGYTHTHTCPLLQITHAPVLYHLRSFGSLPVVDLLPRFIMLCCL